MIRSSSGFGSAKLDGISGVINLLLAVNMSHKYCVMNPFYICRLIE